MSKSELEALLKQLQQALSQEPRLDTETARQLGKLQQDIASRLANDEIDGDSDQSLAEAVTENVDRFESGHPALTMILGRIADILNKLGI